MAAIKLLLRRTLVLSNLYSAQVLCIETEPEKHKKTTFFMKLKKLNNVNSKPDKRINNEPFYKTQQILKMQLKL